jgi:hypothetical protein
MSDETSRRRLFRHAIALELNGATWGDLRDYVRACSTMPDAAPLGLLRDDYYDAPLLGLEEERYADSLHSPFKVADD